MRRRSGTFCCASVSSRPLWRGLCAGATPTTGTPTQSSSGEEGRSGLQVWLQKMGDGLALLGKLTFAANLKYAKKFRF